MGPSGLLVATCLALLAVQFVKLLWARRRFPAGPLPFPLIGSLWRVGWKIRQDTLTKLASKYGDVFTLWIGHVPMVVLTGFKMVKEGLNNDYETLSARPIFPFFKVLGNKRGIIFSNGNTWKQQRHFSQMTMLTLVQMKKGLEHQTGKEAPLLVETFAQEKGRPLDPSLPTMHSAARVISSVIFGSSLPVEDDALHKLAKDLETVANFKGTAGEMFYNIFPSVMQLIPGPHKKALSSCDSIRSFIREEVEKHKKNGVPRTPQSFTDVYLAQIDREKIDLTTTFHEDNLVQVIADLFMAGTGTLAATLSWALLLMAVHPDIQEKVQREIGSALGSPASISYDDRKKLPFTRAVIHEIQRFSNVVLFGLPRLSGQDLNLHGCFIPKDTLVLPDLCSVLLDPKQWETPQQFNPNHFLDKDGKYTAREEFFAFGAGCRACLGRQLAQSELFVMFTSLLKAFTFRLPEGAKDNKLQPVVGAVLRPRPFKICAAPR